MEIVRLFVLLPNGDRLSFIGQRREDIRAMIQSLGGKSELHRAGRWITSSRGNSEESATERKRPRTAASFATKQTLGHGIVEVKGIRLGQAERVR